MPNIARVVELGLPFYCHETVLFDARTTMRRGEPSPTYQEHFELCRGGHELRMKKWEERTAAALAAKGEKT